MAVLVKRYRTERMPTRTDTKRSYEVWISNHIMPKWGDCAITNLEPRPVELWLASLPLAPKSKAHIRGVLRNLWDFAAWSGEVPREQRNSMLYCGRNDFGTRVLKKTGNLKLVMQTMGHVDVKTAMKYQHPELDIVRSALNDTQPSVPPVGVCEHLAG